jgi:hypothetical protein
MRVAIALLLVACGGKTTEGPTVVTDASTTDTTTSTDTGAVTDSAIDFAACTTPGTCVLGGKTCCGVCGAPTLTDVTAVNEKQAAAYQTSICPKAEPCPDCPTAIEPNLQAFCRGSRCTAVDVRLDALSSCSTDSDCMLRYEACCECGASGDFNIIALNKTKTGDYMLERCKPMAACAECAPAYPATLRAVCDTATKHCAVRPT